MIRRIDHIAIAVRDLDRAKIFFSDILGGRELFSQSLPQQKFRWTTVELGTSCFIELIDPTEDRGFLHKFLETRGEGPHHITIQVNDIEETRRVMDTYGVPYFGFGESLPGWKEMFIHPKYAFGTLIQFAEFNPLDWIQPGYIPPSYREFVPSAMLQSKKEKIEVHRVETEEGPKLEIRKGEDAICLTGEDVQELVQNLNKL
jgi:methylmalonyl-CoA/ethylmalonyl-CoA epimerase